MNLSPALPPPKSPEPAAMPTMAAGSTGLATARGFVPALDGLRALAAYGVLTTHVAFQTGSNTGSLINRIYGRMDLAVAVFFALSGFLLWRAHALHARSGRDGTARPAASYLRSRLVRIMPAYLVLVIAALTLLPGNSTTGPVTWIANLTLTQVYIPRTLTDGLTHAWSLSVEMSFYLVLPLLWIAMSRLRGPTARYRIPVILLCAVASLGWAMLPWSALGLPEGLNEQILPPAFASWFAAGMILAELAAAPPGRLARWSAARYARWVWWLAAAGFFLLTTVPAWFTEGFVHPSGPEFAARTALGALVAFCALAPAIFGERFPLLGGGFLRTLGRWSYGIFLWHVVVLHYVFQFLFVPMYSGQMALVWITTVVASTLVAAVSYTFCERFSVTGNGKTLTEDRSGERSERQQLHGQ